MKASPLFLPIVFAVLNSHLFAAELKSVDDFRPAAAKANAVLTIPTWEQTPEAVEALVKDAIAKANQALDQIAVQDLTKVTFKSTITALDDLGYEAALAANRANLIKQTNTNAAMRAAGEKAVKAYQDWVVGVDYREDVYKAIKAFADTQPKLSGEDGKLFKGDAARLPARRSGTSSGKAQRSRADAQGLIEIGHRL
jgi:thimet oligopeptidase